MIQISAQNIQNGCAAGNFGIDADINANGSQFGGAAGTIHTNDWFSNQSLYVGTGRSVIDTTGAYILRQRLSSNENFSFSRRMAVPLNSVISDNRWLDAVYVRDQFSTSGTRDSTTFLGSNKNGDDPNNWSAGVSGVPDKADLVDCYAFIQRTGIQLQDPLWLNIGFSRVGNSGNSNFEAEIYINELIFTQGIGFSTAGPHGGHTAWQFNPDGTIQSVGDLAISVTYGNDIPTIEVRVWVSRSDFQNLTPKGFSFGAKFDGNTYGYADIVLLSDQMGCGLSNSNQTPGPPWGTVNSSKNYSLAYDQIQFLELGLNLTALGIDPFIFDNTDCETPPYSILFKSRSSGSFSSSLEDFIGPFSFGYLPPVVVEALGDTITCDNPTPTLRASNPSSSGNYQWSTIDGNIISNPDSSEIRIDQPGTYILFGAPVGGCEGLLDTIYVPIDTLSPSVNTTGNIIWDCSTPVQLTGGEDNQRYAWSGPSGFSSTDQHPWVSLPGDYKLTVTNSINGCLSDTTSANSIATVLAEPCETDDVATVFEDSLVNIEVLANDNDPDNNIDTSSLSIISGPANGAVTILNGVVTYIPNPDYNGSDTFDYLICDKDNLCDTASVFITVLPVCDLLNSGLIIACDDNNTGLPDDDLFTFTLQPVGNDLSTSYSVSGDVSFGNIPYASPSPDLGPFSIANGPFTITITDDNSGNCQLADIDIVPPAPCSVCDILIDTVIFSDLSACQVFNGSISITASSSYPLEYSIDGGQSWSTNSMFNNLGPLSYLVMVRNQDGSCETAYNINPINLTEPGGPVINNTTQNHPTCPAGTANGSIVIHATVAGDSLAYSIDNGLSFQPDSTFTGLAAGLYYVLVKNVTGGCTSVYENNSVELLAPDCPEICNDGIDNDGDGLTDCEDTDCNPNVSIDIVSNFNGYAISCYGQADGEAEAIPKGGTSPFTYTWNDPASQNTAIATGLSADTFTVIVTDIYGCLDTAGIRLSEPPAITDSISLSDFNGYNVSCFGSSNGVASVFPQGGIPPYAYAWNDPANQTTATATNLTAANYTVTITDANACSLTEAISLTQPPLPLIITNSSDTLLCFGETDGFIDLSVNGGTPGYAFIWNQGASSEYLTNLASGTYIVTVTDANNCTAVDSVQIVEQSLIDISVNSSGISSCGGADGVITITANGGTGSFEYSIDSINWQASNTFNNLSASNYNVYVKNSDGSCITAYIDNAVTLNEPPLPQLNTTTTDLTCFDANDGEATITPISGAAPFDYAWPGGQTSNSLSGLSGGLYLVTVTDANSCSIVDSIIIQEPDSISFALHPVNPTFCSTDDGLIAVLASGGAEIFEYSLDNTNWQTSNTFKFLSIGTYRVFVRNIDGSCPAIPQSISLTAQTEPSCPIDIPNPRPIETQVQTATAVINNSNCGDGFDWTMLNNINTSDDNYTVVDLPKKRTSSCLNFSGFNFNIPIGATITGITLKVEGHYEGTMQVYDLSVRLLDNTGNVIGENKGNHIWNFQTDENWIYGGINELWEVDWSTIDVNNTTFGVSIQVQASNGSGSPATNRGMAFIDYVDMEVHYRPIFQICQAEPAQLFYASPVNDSTTYNWTIPVGALIESGQGNDSIYVNFNGIANGFYDVCVEAHTQQDQCFASDQCCFSFEVISCPEICDNGIDDDGDGLTDCEDDDCSPQIDSLLVSPITNCMLDNGALQIFASNQNLEYSIDRGNTWQDSSWFDSLPPGSYTILINDTTSQCITSYAANPVVLKRPLPPGIDDLLIEAPSECRYQDGSITIISADNGNPALLYTIDGGNTWQPENLFSNLGAGLYAINIANSELPNCIDSTQAVLTEPGNCVDTIYLTTDINTPIDTCLNDFIDLQGSFISIELCSSPDSLLFFFDDSIPCISIETLNGFIGTQEDCIVVCDSNFCDTVIVITTILPLSTPPIAVPECMSTPLNAQATITPLDNDFLFGELEEMGIIEYPSFGAILQDSFNHIFQYIPPNALCNITDTFTYYISNSHASDTAYICIHIQCDDIVIYNGFSPNNDGDNDFFTIENIELFPENELKIFNRWGNQVAFLKDYKNNWDGTWKNVLLPDGVYYYLLYLPDGREFNGYLVINR